MAKTKAEIQREYSKRSNFASQKKYLAERSKTISFRVFTPQDNDILEWLEQQPNKAGYLKDLIRADMNK